ncbi:MAG: cysteine desulfurase [Cellulomonas sp.]|nr:cysteine desulfurase [Cellulomonas sp.]
MTSYLDHGAATPVRASALEALVGASATSGNPASVHGAGRAARRLVEDAREQVAAALGARPGEVVWTSGGTESDNLAVLGLYRAARRTDPTRTRLLVSAVEHHAVLEPARWLAAHEGAQLTELPVDGDGVLDVDVLSAQLARGGVAAVSVMWANNEVGALQPLEAVVSAAARHGVPVHADAVQAVGQVPVDLASSGLAALSVSGHKVGGPQGTGALLLRRGVALDAVQHGGGQERGLRPGSVAVAPVVGFAVAVAEAVGQQPEQAVRLAALRDELVTRVLATVPAARLTGPSDGPRRLPGNAHLMIDGCSGEDLLLLLDAAGIAASTGSACQAGVARTSHVLAAMGVDEEHSGALRLTLGHTSTRADVEALVDVLPGVVARARNVRQAGAA